MMFGYGDAELSLSANIINITKWIYISAVFAKADPVGQWFLVCHSRNVWLQLLSFCDRGKNTLALFVFL